MAFWLDIAAFLLKALIIVAAFGGLAVLIARLARSNEPKDQEIKVRSLDERYDDMRDAMNGALLDRKERKALAKTRKKEDKAAAKTRRGQEPGKRIYVLSFKGDLRASAVKRLGAEIDAVLIAARPANRRNRDPDRKPGRHGDRLRPRRGRDSAPARTEDQSHGFGRSGGGERRLHDGLRGGPHCRRAIRDRGFDRRRGAGAEPPSAPEEERDRLRGDHGRRVQAHRLGPRRDHARGPRTFPREARHDPCQAFKAHVAECRPKVDIDRVANGDYWLAREGLALGLVDEIATGDDLLFRARDSARLYEVSTEARKTLVQQLLSGLGTTAQKAADVVMARLAAR